MKTQKKKSTKKSTRRAEHAPVQTGVAAAYSSRIPKRLGWEMHSQRFSYVAGSVYIGNGTLGVTDEIYARSNANNDYLVGQVPVLFGDANLGLAYMSDVLKHFSRVRVTRAWIHLLALQPKTTASAVVFLAPVRGAGDSLASARYTTGTTSGNTINNVLGMSRENEVASYESRTWDCTRFIAGGTGPRQNEFSVQGAEANTNEYTTVNNLTGITPFSYAVAGQADSATITGNTHRIVIELEMTPLDFIGGQAITYPVGPLAVKAKRPLHVGTQTEAICDWYGSLNKLRKERTMDSTDVLRARLIEAGRGDLAAKLGTTCSETQP